jgi:hypothetical protein
LQLHVEKVRAVEPGQKWKNGFIYRLSPKRAQLSIGLDSTALRSP